GNIFGRSQKRMSWSLFFKSFMRLYGTMSLEILKAVCEIWYL
ncbi:hypothetical protein Goklo_006894, partial [Gossypium klotzschianum]|nr:hypothetical protein [Gossypium klotzschianum]